MKVRKFMAMMVVALLSFNFVSCSDDDDNNGPEDPTTVDLSGKYLGARAVLMKGVQNFDTTHVVVVELQSNGKYSMTLPKSVRKENSSEKKMLMPDVVLKDLTFVAENGVYTLVLGQQMLTFPDMQIDLKSLEAKIDADKKTLDIHYVMQPVGMPFALDYTFKTVTDLEFISGTFEGVAELSVKGSPQGSPKSVAKIFVQKDNKIAILLPEEVKEEAPADRAMVMPSVVINDLTVTKDANGVSTFGFESKEVAAGGMNIVINNFKGKVVDNVLTLDYSFKPGAMPMSVDTKFNGEK